MISCLWKHNFSIYILLFFSYVLMCIIGVHHSNASLWWHRPYSLWWIYTNQDRKHRESNTPHDFFLWWGDHFGFNYQHIDWYSALSRKSHIICVFPDTVDIEIIAICGRVKLLFYHWVRQAKRTYRSQSWC